jgi:hypothetical protein
VTARTREVIAGITTGLLGFALVVFGLYQIDGLIQTNHLIHLLGVITLVPGGIFLLYVGAKVID